MELMVGGDSLPEELVMEIIARLPPKSLALSRCVNKSFNSSLIDPQFLTKLAIEKIRNPDNHTIFCFSSKNFSLYKINILENRKFLGYSFSDQAVKFEHPLLNSKRIPTMVSCNGLLCLVYDDMELVLLNPLTGDGRKFFRRKRLEAYHHVSYGFGYDTRSEDYKIVRIEDRYSERDNRDRIEIFSVKNNFWKNLRLRPPRRRDHSAISAVHVSGVLHWKPFYDHVHDRIVSFHLGDENFGELTVPYREDIDHSRPMAISVFQGCLCMSRTRNACHVVWVMKEYGVEDSWTNIFTIKLFNIDRIYRLINTRGDHPLCYTRDGSFAIMAGYIDYKSEIVIYDPKDKSTNTFSSVHQFIRCVPYIESLVSPYCLNGRRTTRSEQHNSVALAA